MAQAFIERRIPEGFVALDEELEQYSDELVDLYESLDSIATEHGFSLSQWLHITDKILSPSVAVDYAQWAADEWEPTTESINNA